MHHNVKQMGHVLREARKAKGMTQAALAKETHTALRTIIAVENEKRFPTYEVLYRIIRVLDLSADQVFWPERTLLTPEQEQLIHLICTIHRMGESCGCKNRAHALASPAREECVIIFSVGKKTDDCVTVHFLSAICFLDL